MRWLGVLPSPLFDTQRGAALVGLGSGLSYRALVARKDPEHRVEFAALTEEELGSGAVTVAVEYSTLNYKDGLAITGASPIVREYPLILGIDLAGTVVASEDPAFAAGDRVLVNGYGLSETRNGGYTERARLDPGLLVPVPEGLGTRRAMAIGTAGYTAMLCVLALEDGGVKPGDGEVLVTGAAGGVGTVAISLLAGLGYTVVASTGRSAEAAFLGELGAVGVRRGAGDSWLLLELLLRRISCYKIFFLWTPNS